jgi:hypothetical protein
VRNTGNYDPDEVLECSPERFVGLPLNAPLLVVHQHWIAGQHALQPEVTTATE